jgi:hypothetical protein
VVYRRHTRILVGMLVADAYVWSYDGDVRIRGTLREAERGASKLTSIYGIALEFDSNKLLASIFFLVMRLAGLA